jgi:spermidine/putrescine-binding protein
MLTTMLEKQADMCLCSDARMLQAQKEDADIRVSYDGGTRALVYWAIPEDAPHPNAAWAFLKATLDAQRQADFTETIGYSGVVKDSYDLLPAGLKNHVLVNPDNYDQTWSFTADQNEWLAEHASEASDKYATWTGQ